MQAFHRENALRRLARMRERAKHERVSPRALAAEYAALGDKDQAFRWLEEAYRQRCPRLVWLEASGICNPLQATHGSRTCRGE
jgi:hypothetical protein